ncbi:hypothetical protein B5M09_008306 [Aphanomyces astaci]|uniref:HECT-type E3 ubiquitin transferase E3D n=1 Tax=Aphanomyces astaci TaxID=112090 RepID=A0A3R7WGT7_APHAT|nr:hypothetical protein B5M09_008306 [Aphanomyces astaci]
MDVEILCRTFCIYCQDMAEAAAALLKEFEAAKREVESARRHVEETQKAYERERERYAAAVEAKKSYADEVDVLAKKLDTTLSEVTMQPEYIVEFQANIGCYQCYVHVDMSSSSTVPYLQLGSTSNRVELRTSPEHILVDVALDHAVDLASSVVRVQKDHVHVRIPLTSASKENRQSTMTVGLTARSIPRAQLDVQEYAHLHCRCCQANLMTDSETPWTKALPLPSSNWMEMVDFWGAAEGAFEHIPRDGIDAAAGRIYVGSADLLLHRSNVGNVVVATPEPSISSTQPTQAASIKAVLLCAKCSTPLGSLQNGTNVRLFKHCLDTTASIFHSYTSDSVLVAQMLEVIEADGFFRFDVVDEAAADGARRLRVQVLSWDATIQTSEFPTPQKVLKVLFAVEKIGPNESDLPSKELTATTALIDDVVERLQRSATLLPSSVVAGMSKGSIGFLFG